MISTTSIRRSIKRSSSTLKVTVTKEDSKTTVFETQPTASVSGRTTIIFTTSNPTINKRNDTNNNGTNWNKANNNTSSFETSVNFDDTVLPTDSVLIPSTSETILITGTIIPSNTPNGSNDSNEIINMPFIVGISVAAFFASLLLIWIGIYIVKRNKKDNNDEDYKKTLSSMSTGNSQTVERNNTESVSLSPQQQSGNQSRLPRNQDMLPVYSICTINNPSNRQMLHTSQAGNPPQQQIAYYMMSGPVAPAPAYLPNPQLEHVLQQEDASLGMARQETWGTGPLAPTSRSNSKASKHSEDSIKDSSFLTTLLAPLAAITGVAVHKKGNGSKKATSRLETTQVQGLKNFDDASTNEDVMHFDIDGGMTPVVLEEFSRSSDEDTSSKETLNNPSTNNMVFPKNLPSLNAKPKYVAYELYRRKLQDEMTVDPGDEIEILKVYEDSWCYGINLTKNVSGMFPLHCVRTRESLIQKKQESLGSIQAADQSFTSFFSFNNLLAPFKSKQNGRHGSPLDTANDRKRSSDSVATILKPNYRRGESLILSP